MTLVFLDTETTGLEPDLHEVWEIAYAFESGLVRSGMVTHALQGFDPKALELNGYKDRRLGKPFDLGEALDFEADVRAALQGATLVGANPAFDAAFLKARWGFAPWRYRMLDVEAFAMPILGYDEPQGLATIVEDLGSLGKTVFPSDHTATSDVYAVRDAFYALWDLREESQCLQVQSPIGDPLGHEVVISKPLPRRGGMSAVV